MPKRKKVRKRPQKVLDSFFAGEKRGRGRPGVRASEISGRAYNYRLIFSQTWDVVGEPLLKAKTEEEIIQAFQNTSYKQEFAPIASLILEVLRDPDFPKRERQAQINFLADSLAGRGWIKPRTSRDISGRERAKEKRAHHIIRRDYYIECTCRYKGPALHGKCPKCGTDKLALPYLPLGWGGIDS